MYSAWILLLPDCISKVFYLAQFSKDNFAVRQFFQPLIDSFVFNLFDDLVDAVDNVFRDKVFDKVLDSHLVMEDRADKLGVKNVD